MGRVVNASSLSKLARSNISTSGLEISTSGRLRKKNVKSAEQLAVEQAKKRAVDELLKRQEEAKKKASESVSSSKTVISKIIESPKSIVDRYNLRKGPTIERANILERKQLEVESRKQLGRDLLQALKPTKTDIALLGVTAVTPFIGDEALAAGVIGFRRAKAASNVIKTVVKGAELTKKVKTAVKSVPVVTNALKSTRIGTFALGLVGAETAARGAELASKGVSFYKASDSEREVLKDDRFNKILGAGFSSEKESLSKNSSFGLPNGKGISVKSIAYDVSPFLASDKKAFIEGAIKEGINQGLSKVEAEKFADVALRERKFRAGGEVASFLGVSAVVERTGRRLVTLGTEKLAKEGVKVASKKSFGTLFKTGFSAIAPAGFIEASVQEESKQRLRGEKTDYKEVLKQGALGGTFAGFIGGSIVGTVVSKPTTSKTISTIATFTDPFEKPGDILADISIFAEKKILGKTPTQPKLFVTTPINSEILSFGTSNNNKASLPKKPNFASSSKSVGSSKKSSQKFNDFIGFSINKDKTFFSGGKRSKGSSKIISFSPPAPVKTKVNAPIKTSIKSNVFTPINNPFGFSPVNFPVNPFVPTDTPVDTKTNINVPVNPFVPVNIPVVIPQVSLPPPIPFGFNFGTSSGGTSKAKRKTTINELRIGQNILGRFLRL